MFGVRLRALLAVVAAASVVVSLMSASTTMTTTATATIAHTVSHWRRAREKRAELQGVPTPPPSRARARRSATTTTTTTTTTSIATLNEYASTYERVWRSQVALARTADALRVFVHVPKAGGSSAAHLLRRRLHALPPRVLRGTQLLRARDERAAMLTHSDDLLALSPAEQRAVALVVGHRGYGVHTLVDGTTGVVDRDDLDASLPRAARRRAVVYATIVRHPLTRVVSQWRFGVAVDAQWRAERERSETVTFARYWRAKRESFDQRLRAARAAREFFDIDDDGGGDDGDDGGDMPPSLPELAAHVSRWPDSVLWRASLSSSLSSSSSSLSSSSSPASPSNFTISALRRHRTPRTRHAAHASSAERGRKANAAHGARDRRSPSSANTSTNTSDATPVGAASAVRSFARDFSRRGRRWSAVAPAALRRDDYASPSSPWSMVDNPLVFQLAHFWSPHHQHEPQLVNAPAQYRRMNARDLERAKRNLLTFVVVGVLEHADDALAMLPFALGLGDASVELRTTTRRNVVAAAYNVSQWHVDAARGSGAASLDAALVDEVQRALALDLELYAFAAALFERQRHWLTSTLSLSAQPPQRDETQGGGEARLKGARW